MEELPYIPKEIVDIIANFAEGSTGLGFIQSSKYYNTMLSENIVDYFKQYQLELINQKYTIIVNGIPHYGTKDVYYCYDCSSPLNKKKTIAKHSLKCHKRQPLICTSCDSPRRYHRVCETDKRTCAFMRFYCCQCDESYYHFEHNSRTCPERVIYCKGCSSRHKLKNLEKHKTIKYCYICKCKELIQNYW